MSEPRRRWFQFHLSTAIVGLFAASLILWAQLREHWRWYELTSFYHHSTSWVSDRGWPFEYQRTYYVVDEYDRGKDEGSKYSPQHPPPRDVDNIKPDRWWQAIP